MSTELGQCTAKVQARDRWEMFRPRTCSRKATVSRDGKSFCELHDPVALARRAALRDAEYAKQREEMTRAHQDRIVGESIRVNDPDRYVAILNDLQVKYG